MLENGHQHNSPQSQELKATYEFYLLNASSFRELTPIGGVNSSIISYQTQEKT